MMRVFLKHLKTIEAVYVGVLLIQTLRFLIGMLYSRIAGASVDGELVMLGALLCLPLLVIALGRVRWMFLVAVVLVAVGRVLMIIEPAPIYAIVSAGLVVGGALFYVALLIINRARLLPHMFILAFAIDQIIRALGNTIDPTWSPAFVPFQIGLSAVVILLAVINVIDAPEITNESSEVSLDHSLLTFWGAVAMGAMLFLELSLLALPNAIAGRANGDYTTVVPLLLMATVMPLVPAIRLRVRSMLGVFDNYARGWVWMLLIMLMLVVGMRLSHIPMLGVIALVVAQFAVNMVWWWLIRPRGEHEQGRTGVWLVLMMCVLGLLVVGDLFTYDYAYVQDLNTPLALLNTTLPSLLRGLRGMGLGLLLLSGVLVTLPMMHTSRRMPWTGGTRRETLVGIAAVLVLGMAGVVVSRAPLITPTLTANQLRIGTYNIHSGYSEQFDFDMEAIASSIEKSGASVVLLQAVDIGRLTSFGVDQSLWLSRRLGMDVRFYPTNEGLHGLAVLSHVPIVHDDGALLASVGQQTGLQRVQVQLNEGTINLYNTSLGVLLTGADEREQQRQLDQIFAIIDDHIMTEYDGELGRTVLGGTFNNVPSSPLMMTLDATLFYDAFAGSDANQSATLVRTDVEARVDYLWLWGRTLPSIGNGIIDSPASDHRLVFVEVSLQNDESP
jgi:endonuclease/exonuclease/phosphatase family metal-dependent hydrolase